MEHTFATVIYKDKSSNIQQIKVRLLNSNSKNNDLRSNIREILNSENEKSSIDELRDNDSIPPKTVTVLSCLLSVQDNLHYIPDEAIEEIADFMDKTINDVWGVASFYTNFRFSPPGSYSLDICWGPSCHLSGAQKILRGIHEKLGINSETETDDGKISLGYSTCLGACAQAPVYAINHELKGNASVEKIMDTINKLK